MMEHIQIKHIMIVIALFWEHSKLHSRKERHKLLQYAVHLVLLTLNS